MIVNEDTRNEAAVRPLKLFLVRIYNGCDHQFLVVASRQTEALATVLEEEEEKEEVEIEEVTDLTWLVASTDSCCVEI